MRLFYAILAASLTTVSAFAGTTLVPGNAATSKAFSNAVRNSVLGVRQPQVSAAQSNAVGTATTKKKQVDALNSGGQSKRLKGIDQNPAWNINSQTSGGAAGPRYRR